MTALSLDAANNNSIGAALQEQNLVEMELQIKTDKIDQLEKRIAYQER